MKNTKKQNPKIAKLKITFANKQITTKQQESLIGGTTDPPISRGTKTDPDHG